MLEEIFSVSDDTLLQGTSLLLRKEVIQWFGSAERFIEFHKQPIDLKNDIED